MNQRITQREKLQIRGELFALCSAGGDANLRRAAGIIRGLSPEERRDARAGIQTLSEMIDDITLEELRRQKIALFSIMPSDDLRPLHLGSTRIDARRRVFVSPLERSLK